MEQYVSNSLFKNFIVIVINVASYSIPFLQLLPMTVRDQQLEVCRASLSVK